MFVNKDFINDYKIHLTKMSRVENKVISNIHNGSHSRRDVFV